MGDRRLSEIYTPIPLVEPKDYGSAGVDSESVNMALGQGIEAVFNFGAITGNTTLIVYAGATDGAKTTALAFNYRLGSGAFKAAVADQLGDLVAVASTGLLLTAATFVHKQITIEIDAVDLPDAQPWLTFSFDSVATVLLLSATGNPRRIYYGHTPPSMV